MAAATIAPDECGETAVAILQQVVAGYAVRGVTVRLIMADNGSPYVSRAFAEACRILKLKHIRTRRSTPRTNGEAERFIQTAPRECAYATCFKTLAQRQAALGDWLHHYNWHRPHTAAGGLAPISRLKLSQNNLLKLHSQPAGSASRSGPRRPDRWGGEAAAPSRRGGRLPQAITR